MATFKYLGPTDYPWVVTPGPTKAFRFHKKDGSIEELQAANQEIGFQVNDTIEVTDDRVIRHLNADPRFEFVS